MDPQGSSADVWGGHLVNQSPDRAWAAAGGLVTPPYRGDEPFIRFTDQEIAIAVRGLKSPSATCESEPKTSVSERVHCIPIPVSVMMTSSLRQISCWSSVLHAPKVSTLRTIYWYKLEVCICFMIANVNIVEKDSRTKRLFITT